MRNRAMAVVGSTVLSMLVISCADAPGDGPTGIRSVRGPSFVLVPDPGVPDPLGEEIVVCKEGVGSGMFTVTGTDLRTNTPINQAFSLTAGGQCERVGFYGRAGANVSITETPDAGYQVALMALHAPDQHGLLVRGQRPALQPAADGAEDRIFRHRRAVPWLSRAARGRAACGRNAP